MDAISFGSLSSAPSLPPVPNPAALEQLIRLWQDAKRPAIIVGTGASRCSDLLPDNSDKSQTLLTQLAEATLTPIFYSSKFSPRMQHDHLLRAGPAVKLALLPSINEQAPDLVILIGARTGFLLGGRSGAILPNPGCTLVQVDLDGTEIGKSLHIDLGIVSDTRYFVISMLETIKSSPFAQKIIDHKDSRCDPWIKTTYKLKSLIHEKYRDDSKETKSQDGFTKLHPYHALNTLFSVVAPLEPIILIDGGEAGCWALDLLETARPTHSLVSTGYLGFLGNGYGYSLGAAFAFPDRLILNCHGDGSAGFHIQELDTYSRHSCKILTVILNNDFWGMSIAGQNIIYGSSEASRPCASLSPNYRYEIVAQGFNCESARIENHEAIIPDVEKIVGTMMGSNRAGLVNLIVSTEPVTETTKGMVGMVDKKEEDRWIVVPYYDNVPRPYFKDGKGVNGAGH